MPRYQQAQTHDIVRSVKNTQKSVLQLQVQSASKVRQNLNQTSAALNPNGYFWGGDDTGWVAVNGTFVVASDPPAGAPYAYAGLYDNDGVTVGYMAAQNNLMVAIPFQQYQVVAYVCPSSTSVILGMSWFNNSLGSVTGPTNPTFTVTANSWSRIVATLIAPAGAGYACPLIGTAAADGSTVYAEAITVTPLAAPGAWQDMRPLSNSFIGTVAGRYPPQYRLNPDGTVEVAGFVQLPSSGGPNFNSITFATLPTAYRPNSNSGHKWPCLFETNVAPVGTPHVQVDTSGNLQFHSMPISGMASNTTSIAGRYPLDSSGLITS